MSDAEYDPFVLLDITELIASDFEPEEIAEELDITVKEVHRTLGMAGHTYAEVRRGVVERLAEDGRFSSPRLGGGNKWTVRDDALLIANYPFYGTDMAHWCEPVDHPASSIWERARTLGVRRVGGFAERDVLAMEGMAARGMTLREVAEATGFHSERIRCYQNGHEGRTLYAKVRKVPGMAPRGEVERAVMDVYDPSKTIRQLAEETGCNYTSVWYVLKRRGLMAKGPKPDDRRPPWTEAEDEALRRNYPLHGSDVSKWDEPVNRSRTATVARAHVLGVKKSKP